MCVWQWWTEWMPIYPLNIPNIETDAIIGENKLRCTRHYLHGSVGLRENALTNAGLAIFFQMVLNSNYLIWIKFLAESMISVISYNVL